MAREVRHETGRLPDAVGHASSLFLAVTFARCVAFYLLLSEHAMYQTWQALLPGFEWLSWPSFFLGLIESYGYGRYFVLVWVPIYNVFAVRSEAKKKTG